VPRLALVGNLSRDVVDGGPPRIGGAPYYAARAWRALAARATIFTRCGPEERLAYARRLTALGLPVVMLRGKRTTSFAISYDGDARVMAVEQVGDAWTPHDVAAVAGGAWVHVAPLLRSDFPTATLGALARGRRVSLDGQGLVRVPAPGPLRLDADFDAAVLAHVDILKLAEEEAEVIGAVDRLGVAEVVVTYGARGSCVYAGGRAERVGAWPVAADPTGSGDAFAAAYLTGRSQGLTPASAARRATALVGALLTRRAS
jgi:sugar/nucleoside kinase (ribokinase family)